MWTRHGGNTRKAPSSQPTYQSGWAAVDTAAGLNGPYSHTGLIWAKPPRALSTAATAAKRPMDRSVYVGQRNDPTTLRSVRPGPLNWVCFWRQRIARWAVSRGMITEGTSKTWRMKSRGSRVASGYAPPKNKMARQV